MVAPAATMAPVFQSSQPLDDMPYLAAAQISNKEQAKQVVTTNDHEALFQPPRQRYSSWANRRILIHLYYFKSTFTFINTKTSMWSKYRL